MLQFWPRCKCSFCSISTESNTLKLSSCLLSAFGSRKTDRSWTSIWTQLCLAMQSLLKQVSTDEARLWVVVNCLTPRIDMGKSQASHGETGQASEEQEGALSRAAIPRLWNSSVPVARKENRTNRSVYLFARSYFWFTFRLLFLESLLLWNYGQQCHFLALLREALPTCISRKEEGIFPLHWIHDLPPQVPFPPDPSSDLSRNSTDFECISTAQVSPDRTSLDSQWERGSRPSQDCRKTAPWQEWLHGFTLSHLLNFNDAPPKISISRYVNRSFCLELIR